MSRWRTNHHAMKPGGQDWSTPCRLTTTRKITLGQTSTGHLTVNGRKVSPTIQMQFATTTDTLHPWRRDAQERFLRLMTDQGLAPQARAILAAHATMSPAPA